MKFNKSACLVVLCVIGSFFSLSAQDQQLTIPLADSIKKWRYQLKVPIVAVGIIENDKIKETKVFSELKTGNSSSKNVFLI